MNVVAQAALAFASTDLDDLITLTALTAAARAQGRPRYLRIWLGHTIGMTIIGATAQIIALSTVSVGADWMRLLGVVPLVLALRWIAPRGPGPVQPVAGLGAIAAVTIAGGGDNLAVFVPLLHGLSTQGTVFVAATFLALTAVWSLGAFALSSLPGIASLARRSGRYLVPVAYVAVGLSILT